MSLDAHATTFINAVKSALDTKYADQTKTFVKFALSHPIRRRFVDIFKKAEPLSEPLDQTVADLRARSDSTKPSDEEFFRCAAVLAFLGVPLSQKDNHGRTLMHYAAQLGDVACFDFLRSFKDLSCTLPDNFGRSVVHLAAASGRKEILDRLLPMNLPQSADFYGQTPADLAARGAHWACVDVLTRGPSQKGAGLQAKWHLPLLNDSEKKVLNDALNSKLLGVVGRGGSATVNAVKVNEELFAVRVDLTPRNNNELPLHIQLIDGASSKHSDLLKSSVLNQTTRNLIMPLAGCWAWRSPAGELSNSEKPDYVEVWVEVSYFVRDKQLTALLDLKAKPMERAEADAIYDAIAATRDQLLNMGLAHGDLKPANIFIAQEATLYRAMFIDFTSLCRSESLAPPLMTTRGYYKRSGDSGAANDAYAIRVVRAELSVRVGPTLKGNHDEMAATQRREKILSDAFKIFCSFNFNDPQPKADLSVLRSYMALLLPSSHAVAQRTLRRIRRWADHNYVKTDQHEKDVSWLAKFSPPLSQIATLFIERSGEQEHRDLFLAALDDAIFDEQVTTRLGISAIQSAQPDDDELLRLFEEHGREWIADVTEASKEEDDDLIETEVESTPMPSLTFSEFQMSTSDIDIILSFFLAATPQPSVFSYELASQCVQLEARGNIASKPWIEVLSQYLQKFTGAGLHTVDVSLLSGALAETHLMAQYTPSEVGGVRFGRVARFDDIHLWIQDAVPLPGDLQYVDAKLASDESNGSSWSVDCPMFIRHLPCSSLRRVHKSECTVWSVSASAPQQMQAVNRATPTTHCGQEPASRHATWLPVNTADAERFLESLRHATHVESFSADGIDLEFLRGCIAALVDKPFMSSIRVRVKSASAGDLLRVTFLCRGLGWAHVVIDCNVLLPEPEANHAEASHCNGIVAASKLNVDSEWQLLAYYEATKHQVRPDMIPQQTFDDIRAMTTDKKWTTLTKGKSPVSEDHAMAAVYFLSKPFKLVMDGLESQLPRAKSFDEVAQQLFKWAESVQRPFHPLDYYYNRQNVLAGLQDDSTIVNAFLTAGPHRRLVPKNNDLKNLVRDLVPKPDSVVRPAHKTEVGPKAPLLIFVTVLNLSTCKRGSGVILGDVKNDAVRFYTARHNLLRDASNFAPYVVISIDTIGQNRIRLLAKPALEGGVNNQILDSFMMPIPNPFKAQKWNKEPALWCQYGIWICATQYVLEVKDHQHQNNAPCQFAVGYPEGSDAPHVFFSRQVSNDAGDLTNAGVFCLGLSGAMIFPFAAAEDSADVLHSNKSIVTRGCQDNPPSTGFLQYPGFKSATV